MEDFIKGQREKLENELRRIERELTDYGVKTGEGYKPITPEIGDSTDDNALEIEAYEQNMATESTLLGLKEQVESALSSMEQGIYGYCMEGSGKHEIDRARLEAYPEATTCIEHASAEE